MKHLLPKDILISKIKPFNNFFSQTFLNYLNENSIFIPKSSDIKLLNNIVQDDSFEKNIISYNKILHKIRFITSNASTAILWRMQNITKKITYFTDIPLSIKEKKDFIIFLDSGIQFYLENRFDENRLKEMKNSNTTILDLFHNFFFKEKIVETEFLLFIDFVDNFIEHKNYFSYVSYYVLAIVINMMFEFLYTINNDNVLYKNNTIPKKPFYYQKIIEFLSLIEPNILKKSYIYRAYLNTSLPDDLLLKIGLKGQDNSHYIQKAYLNKVVGSQVYLNPHIRKDKPINILKTSDRNPYCNPYFYGDSLPKNSIEHKFKAIENHYEKYLNIFHNDVNLSVSVNSKIYFLINYIRSPAFLDDLLLSYDRFNTNYVYKYSNELGDLKKGYEVSEEIMSNPSYHETFLFFKNLQYSLIEGLIEKLENKKFNLFSLTKKTNYLIFTKPKKNQYFYQLILTKIFNFFSSTNHTSELQEINITEYSYSFFIPKIKNKFIFEDFYPIEYCYFPIKKNVICIIKEKNISVHLNEKCMIDFHKIPFIACTII